MKLLVVLALAVAAANADISQTLQKREPYATILKYNNDADPEGNFQYEFETENGIKTIVQGTLSAAGTDAEALEIRGQVQYTAPDGTPVNLQFVAGPNGYEPQGPHIPTPPPLPESVVRALEYIRTHPQYQAAAPLPINTAKLTLG